MSPKLSLHQTDVSYILNGEVSILHTMNICKTHGLQILNGTAVNCLVRKGIAALRDLGKWKRDGLGKYRGQITEHGQRPHGGVGTEQGS